MDAIDVDQARNEQCQIFKRIYENYLPDSVTNYLDNKYQMDASKTTKTICGFDVFVDVFYIPIDIHIKYTLAPELVDTEHFRLAIGTWELLSTAAKAPWELKAMHLNTKE